MKQNPSDKFIDIQANFYHYLMTESGLAKKTCSDYMSRLRFLSKTYILDYGFNQNIMNHILKQEDNARLSRQKYNTKKSISDFSAGLTKFLEFVKSDYITSQNKRVEKEVENVNNSNISQTEKENIIKSRIGQGYFRKELIQWWEGCSVTGCKMTDLLVASHIKPWKDSSNQERLDRFNGLLLLPNLDKLFDRGYISFRSNGKIIISRYLPKTYHSVLGIDDSLKLNKTISSNHKQYLSYHLENCFIH